MNKRFQHIPFPWYTTLFTVLLIVYYIVLVILANDWNVDIEDMLDMGAPSAILIFKGHFYGLFLNTLIHENYWHLLLNVSGLLFFGFYLERYKGWRFLAFFGFFSAIIGSIIQLNISDDAGIGISSSLFALFIYSTLHTIFVRRANQKVAIPIAIAVIGSLIFFALSNYWLEDKVTIGAKVGGVIWGIIFFYSERLPSPYKFLIPFSFILVLSISLFYAPWNSMWQTYNGIEAHNNQDLDQAEIYYVKALDLDNSNYVAAENYRRIKVYRLSLLAHAAHEKGDFSEARRYYLKILALGKNNRWVIENLKELP